MKPFISVLFFFLLMARIPLLTADFTIAAAVVRAARFLVDVLCDGQQIRLLAFVCGMNLMIFVNHVLVIFFKMTCVKN